MSIDLIGLEILAGSRLIEAKDIAEDFGKPDRSLARCGTTILHRLEEDESLESLARDASSEALLSSGITYLSGIYSSVCCSTTKYLMPGLARLIGYNLGMKDIPMVSMSMGCVGGIHALQAAYNQLKVDLLEGRKGNVLVIMGDHTSRALDDSSWDTAGIFSDGVAALVLSTEKEGNYSLTNVRSANLAGDILSMNIATPSEKSKDRKPTFRMDGTKVFDFAYKEAYPAILRLLDLKKLPENCYLIPHQASGVVLKHLQREHRIRPDQIYTEGIGNVGNMTGASTIFGLKDVIKRSIAGNRDIILGAFGAELAVGAVYLKKKDVDKIWMSRAEMP